MEFKKIGMRNVKTGISVGLSIFAGNVGLIDNPFFTAAAGLDAVKNTVKRSVETGWHRILGTILGGVFGFLFGSYLNVGPLAAAVGVCMIIYICNLTKINNSINMSLVTFLSIILSLDANTDILNYSIVRTWDTSIGVIIGLSVNYFIHRSKYFNAIVQDMKLTRNEIIDLTKHIISKDNKIDLVEMDECLGKFESLYRRFVVEIEYSNKNIEFSKLKHSLYVCKHINSHLNAMALIEGEITITPENMVKINELWPDVEIERPIVKDKNPVFNYHIKMILKEIESELYY